MRLGTENRGDARRRWGSAGDGEEALLAKMSLLAMMVVRWVLRCQMRGDDREEKMGSEMRGAERRGGDGF